MSTSPANRNVPCEMKRKGLDLMPLAFALLLSAVSPSSASAQRYLIKWSGPFGSGSAHVQATNDGGGQYQISSMSSSTQNGSAITLLGTGSYGGNDNFIFPSNPPSGLVTNSGFAFSDGVNYYTIFYPIQSLIPFTHAIPGAYYECDSGTGSNCFGPAPQVASPLTSLTITPEPATLDAVDPYPTLFLPASSTITTDPNVLSNSGRPVSSVAADGIARIVLRITGLTQSQQINVSILDDTHNIPTTGEDGTLSLIGGTATGATVSPTTQSVGLQYDAFVVYQSPIDFVRASYLGAFDRAVASRQITIQVTDSSNNPLASPLPLRILRPPVFFVHGLWSGPGTWGEFEPALHNSLPGISSYRADYEAYNWDFVARNTPRVLDQAGKALNSFRILNSAAAAQMDFVVHSMGGLISDTMPSLPGFRAQGNHGQGFIHKLITIDTPYLGSQLATGVDGSNFACRKFLATAGAVPGGAIYDLDPNNPFLQTFNPAPSGYAKHAIASYVLADQAQAAGSFVNTFFFYGSPFRVCESIFASPPGNAPPGFSFNTYFSTLGDPYDGNSDLIVSVRSQLAGREFSPGTTAHITSLLAHSHILVGVVIPVNLPGALDSGVGSPESNPGLVLELLNTPTGDSNVFLQ